MSLSEANALDFSLSSTEASDFVSLMTEVTIVDKNDKALIPRLANYFETNLDTQWYYRETTNDLWSTWLRVKNIAFWTGIRRSREDSEKFYPGWGIYKNSDHAYISHYDRYYTVFQPVDAIYEGGWLFMRVTNLTVFNNRFKPNSPTFLTTTKYGYALFEYTVKDEQDTVIKVENYFAVRIAKKIEHISGVNTFGQRVVFADKKPDTEHLLRFSIWARFLTMLSKIPSFNIEEATRYINKYMLKKETDVSVIEEIPLPRINMNNTKRKIPEQEIQITVKDAEVKEDMTVTSTIDGHTIPVTLDSSQMKGYFIKARKNESGMLEIGNDHMPLLLGFPMNVDSINADDLLSTELDVKINDIRIPESEIKMTIGYQEFLDRMNSISHAVIPELELDFDGLVTMDEKIQKTIDLVDDWKRATISSWAERRLGIREMVIDGEVNRDTFDDTRGVEWTEWGTGWANHLPKDPEEEIEHRTTQYAGVGQNYSQEERDEWD